MTILALLLSTADPSRVDGATPLEFAAVALAGIALVAALAALIMGRRRPPT